MLSESEFKYAMLIRYIKSLSEIVPKSDQHKERYRRKHSKESELTKMKRDL